MFRGGFEDLQTYYAFVWTTIREEPFASARSLLDKATDIKRQENIFSVMFTQGDLAFWDRFQPLFCKKFRHLNIQEFYSYSLLRRRMGSSSQTSI